MKEGTPEDELGSLATVAGDVDVTVCEDDEPPTDDEAEDEGE